MGNFAVKAAAAFPDTEFVLADPSGSMLEILRKNPGIRGRIVQKTSEEPDFPESGFDVVTAIPAHHYSDRDSRRRATLNRRRMLKPGGIHVTFENIHPLSPGGVEIAMRR